MQTLASPIATVRGQVASLIATISSIEVPRGEWQDLIPKLCEGAQNTENSEFIRMSALQTLGYICEELSPADLTPEIKNLVMLALTHNISSSPE